MAPPKKSSSTTEAELRPSGLLAGWHHCKSPPCARLTSKGTPPTQRAACGERWGFLLHSRRTRLAYFQARVGKRVLEIFGPSLAKPKIWAAKAKCTGDTQYRRAHFNAGCVEFGESGDVENLFNTLQDSLTSHKVTPLTLSPLLARYDIGVRLKREFPRRVRSRL